MLAGYLLSLWWSPWRRTGLRCIRSCSVGLFPGCIAVQHWQIQNTDIIALCSERLAADRIYVVLSQDIG